MSRLPQQVPRREESGRGVCECCEDAVYSTWDILGVLFGRPEFMGVMRES